MNIRVPLLISGTELRLKKSFYDVEIIGFVAQVKFRVLFLTVESLHQSKNVVRGCVVQFIVWPF